MNAFALASFFLALLSGSSFSEQEGHDIKGEEVSRQSSICQVASFSDAPDEDLTEDELS